MLLFIQTAMFSLLWGKCELIRGRLIRPFEQLWAANQYVLCVGFYSKKLLNVQCILGWVYLTSRMVVAVYAF